MVRFIIKITKPGELWDMHLHSNMVRFIIYKENKKITRRNTIYIPIWLDLLYYKHPKQARQSHYLHSNMVRFIIKRGGLRLT